MDSAQRNRLSALLERTAVFHVLDAAARDAVLTACRLLQLGGGDTLFAAGDPSDALYVLVAGSLGAFSPAHDGARDRLAGVIVPGETIGELGLITDRPRTTTVRALRDCTLLRLPREGFMGLVDVHPQAILAAARAAVEHLFERREGEALGVPRTLALLPCDAGIDARGCGERLCRALLPYGDALVIDAALGRGRDAAWFSERERDYPFVLYVADGASDWRELCLRQADALLLLADAARLPSAAWPDAHARADAGARHRPRHLLLLHADGHLRPGAAAAWRAAFADPPPHHHLRDRHDLARLARRLAGRATGLVCSGGGARGFAHIGVVRALRELGIDIDVVGGTSIGAIIAAGVACEWDDATLLERCRHAFVDGHPLADWTLPLVALSHGRRTAHLLREAFGACAIEDLPLSFFCVSANLTRGSAEIHRDGPLWLWLRASTAIPGILPPVLHRGQVHADGAVINNLPTDVMRAQGVGEVIAVDISADDALHATIEEYALPAPARVWRQHRRGERPGIAAILLRAGMVNAEVAGADRRALATQLLTPPLGEIGLLDWRRFQRAVDLGYRYTLETLGPGCAING